MTRLAQVKAERDKAQRDSWTNHMALNLALTSKPDHKERIKETDGAGQYVISAYGLTRCEGGYVTVRFIYPGQKDSIRAYVFDDWCQMVSGIQFAAANDRIKAVRYRLLNAEPVGV